MIEEQIYQEVGFPVNGSQVKSESEQAIQVGKILFCGDQVDPTVPSKVPQGEQTPSALPAVPAGLK